MKKYRHGISGVLIFVMLLQIFITVTVVAATNTEYFYHVRGYSSSGMEGIPVTINICYPGKNLEDLNTTSAKDVLVYHGQTTTQSTGLFEVKFKTTQKGNYTALVKCGTENIKNIKCQEAYEYSGTPVFSMDFETMPQDLSIIGTVTRELTDAQHGYSLKCIPNATDVSIWKNLDTPLANGVYLLEYQTNFTRTDNYSYLRMNNEKGQTWRREHLFEAVAFDNNAKMGYFNDLRGWDLIPYAVYQKDTWYDVKAWLDFNKHTISYYINGAFIGSTQMNADMDQIWGFEFKCEKNTGGTQYLDNISLKYADYSLIKSLSSQEVPQYLLNSIKITASDKTVGNIFFNNKENFIWNITNSDNVDQYVNITYELLDDNANIIAKTNKQVTIEKETTKEVVEPIEFKKFGLYKMRITVQNNDVYAQNALSLSFVNAAPKLTDLGVCTHFGQNKGEVSQLLPLVEKMGTGWIRDEIWWSDFEKTKGVYKIPSKNQKVIDDANAKGIEILQLLDYGNTLYGTAAPWEDDVVLAGYEEYCYQLALALKGKVKYFEVWNEYDLASSYGVDGYIKLLKAGYNGVKRANPDAVVVAIAPLDVGFAWISKVLPALNGKRYMDVIAIHPYNYNIPEHGDADWGYVGKFKKLRWRMNHYGYGDVPVWATELGWPQNQSPQQAEYLVRLNLLNTAHHMMDKMFIYDMQNDGSQQTQDEHNFGLIDTWRYVDVPYAAKESYLAISNYNAMFKDAVIESYNEGTDGNYTYKYTKSDGTKLYALWNINNTQSNVTIKTDASSAILYDMYGNPEKVAVKNGEVNVGINGKPVYLKLLTTAIQVTVNGEIINSLKTIKFGDKILAEAKNLPNGAMLYAAGYKNGKMVYIDTASSAQTLSLEIKRSDYDSVKFFLWSGEKSLCENVELNGELL